ncbi:MULTISPECIES: MarR family winged helix-turn-helix transcriptional regulator [Kocuria]|uniref:MarR family winged helix-turn-helix transcriptional regulator n=1 Tax=Kocuria TaxID=57493 RepID=UPI0002EAA4A7|nr:MarR family transcriptional regulator [Kocuria rhizophila]MXN63102.1 MarR family transcriptional regulator [Bacillus sp. BGMRC0062]MCT1915948.1 MarR family transcriptional regulator [Kocuria rhizophila]RLP59757.1 MarR family transcriptional regulator [Kocuria rhizophila]WSY88166.1 MarR family transcriptional regulator [Kocuria rhizophila]WSZ53592.1 MarR family transcriptional regulator [Kocuria rhizophila]
MPSEARRPEDRSEPTAAGSTTGAEGADRWDTWRLYFETTARLTSRVEERLKAQGCSLMEYQLLLLLHEAPGRCLRMGELARRLVFSPSRLNYQVKVLGERGWVQRRRAQGDGRGWEAALTAEGAQAFRRLRPDHARDVEELFFAALTQDDVARLGDIMARLARGLGEGRSAPERQ